MTDQIKKPSFFKRMPPLYKKRLLQALAGYLIVLVAIGALIHIQGPKTIKKWEDLIPHISAPIWSETSAAEETPADPVLPPPEDTAHAEQAVTDPATAVTTPPTETAVTDPLTAPLTTTAIDAPLVIPPKARKAAYISIIITNAGISESATNRAFGELPVDFAFAYSPYAENLQVWLKKAAVSKRESLLLVPMEPINFPKDDPGPKTLLTRLSAKENESNLDWIVSRAEKGSIIGLMNDKGNRFLNDTKTLLPVFGAMAQKNLPFIELSLEGSPQALATADMSGLSYLAADMKIDNDASSAAVIQQQLVSLEKLAQERGYAVGVADPYPVSVATLKTWADSLDSRGIRLVPLTKVFKEMSRAVDHETKE